MTKPKDSLRERLGMKPLSDGVLRLGGEKPYKRDQLDDELIRMVGLSGSNLEIIEGLSALNGWHAIQTIHWLIEQAVAKVVADEYIRKLIEAQEILSSEGTGT